MKRSHKTLQVLNNEYIEDIKTFVQEHLDILTLLDVSDSFFIQFHVVGLQSHD